MSQDVQEISPLDISFSNDKGFQPSTPSQASPPRLSQKQEQTLHVKTPIQIWEQNQKHSLRMNYVSPFRVDTPPSKRSIKVSQSLKKYNQTPKEPQLERYWTRYSSVKKVDIADSLPKTKILYGTLPSYNSISYKREPIRDPVQKKKKMYASRWNQIDQSSHLKEISRLNNLITKVQTHVTIYNRLYPQKRK